MPVRSAPRDVSEPKNLLGLALVVVCGSEGAPPPKPYDDESTANADSKSFGAAAEAGGARGAF